MHQAYSKMLIHSAFLLHPHKSLATFVSMRGVSVITIPVGLHAGSLCLFHLWIPMPGIGPWLEWADARYSQWWAKFN